MLSEKNAADFTIDSYALDYNVLGYIFKSIVKE